jgi:hypothetical protein
MEPFDSSFFNRSVHPLDLRPKTFKGLTPYEFICKQWTDEPEFFKIDPIHQMPGLDT